MKEKNNNAEKNRLLVNAKMLRELAKLARRMRTPFKAKNPYGTCPAKGNI